MRFDTAGRGRRSGSTSGRRRAAGPAFVAAAVALVAASIGGPSPADAGSRACRPPGAKVLLATSEGTLYKVGKRRDTRYVVCRGRRSKPLVLGGEDCFDAEAPSMFVISGRWLGYVYLTCSQMSGAEAIVVVDLRTRKRHFESGITDTPAAVDDPYDTVEALAVTKSGAAAWIMSYALGGADKRRMYEVRATNVGRSGGTLLDAGPDVAPNSLAVASELVYWTRGGTPRSGSLR